MVIMSDAEAFGLKLTVVILSMVIIIGVIKLCNTCDNEMAPEIVHDTIEVTDTITIHDTITKTKEIYLESIIDTNNYYEIN